MSSRFSIVRLPVIAAMSLALLAGCSQGESAETLADGVIFLLDGHARSSGTLDQLLEDTQKGNVEEAIAELMLRRDAQATQHQPPAPGGPNPHLETGAK